MAHDQLVLHYQPTIDLTIGRTIGVEALVRWQHPDRGLIPPMSFIPDAEETDLAMPLTRWVVNRALQQRRAWLENGLDVDVAVNFSERSLLDAGLPGMTHDLLKIWRLDPGNLKADIPDSGLRAAPGIETVTKLGAMGIGLAVDDFDTRAASLRHLARLPVREIKVEDGDDSILRPFVDLGHRMGLKVIAKGVEDQQALDRLRRLGCDSAQGFHLGPPMVAADLALWLRQSAWPLAEHSPRRMP
jgi:EAL domain-containing protein (putative c-di-GMP-specific phosphodiesterase class I)